MNSNTPDSMTPEVPPVDPVPVAEVVDPSYDEAIAEIDAQEPVSDPIMDAAPVAGIDVPQRAFASPVTD